MNFIVTFVYPFVLFALGYFVNTLVIFHQFRDSIGGYRVKAVVAATREFKEPDADTGIINNRYRYGLGIIVDDLIHRDTRNLQKCPLLIDRGNVDRWAKFNMYVRPVMNDINPYSFLSVYSPLSPLLRQLEALTDLCHAIEVTVMEIDAAFQPPFPIIEWKPVEGKDDTYDLMIIRKPEEDKRVDMLTSALDELDKSWEAWLKVTKAKNIKTRFLNRASLF